MAIVVLLFVVLYKFCDAFAGVLDRTIRHRSSASTRRPTRPSSKASASPRPLIGGFAGGAVARALPLSTSLWVGGILQLLSNLSFAALAVIGPIVPALTATIIIENFCGAIGTVIFVAYLSALCGVRAQRRRNSHC